MKRARRPLRPGPRRSSPWAVLGMGCVGAAATLACSDGGLSYAPYEGTAYPNQRPAFENGGRLLGYVANRMSDSVSVLDLDAMTVIGEAPVGRDPVDTDGPRRIALDERAGLAYVALSYPNDTLGPHAAELRETARPGYVLALALDDLRPVGEQRVAANAEDIVFSPGRDELIVSHNDALRSVQEVELEARRATIDFVSPASGITDRTARVRPLKLCVAPTTVLYAADGTRAYVACTGEDQVTVVDTTIPEIRARIPAGEGITNQPYALSPDPDGERIAVSNQVARTVSIISMTDEPALLSTVFLNGVPRFAGWASKRELVVPTQDYNGVVLIDAETATVVEEVAFARELCSNPNEALFAPDGRLFMVCEGDHYSRGSVVQVDPATLELIAHAEVGIYPDRLALRPPAP